MIVISRRTFGCPKSVLASFALIVLPKSVIIHLCSFARTTFKQWEPPLTNCIIPFDRKHVIYLFLIFILEQQQRYFAHKLSCDWVFTAFEQLLMRKRKQAVGDPWRRTQFNCHRVFFGCRVSSSSSAKNWVANNVLFISHSPRQTGRRLHSHWYNSVIGFVLLVIALELTDLR